MATDLSTAQLLKGYSRFFHRYHFIVFVVTAVGGLAIVVFLLNQTIQTSTDLTQNTETPQATSFDTATIKRLEELKQTGGSEPLQLPANTRINPFVE